MPRKELFRWTIAIVLITSTLAMAGFHFTQKNTGNEAICQDKESVEKDPHSLRSGIPMWESLSRHLIAVPR